MRMRYLTTILPHFTAPLPVTTQPLPDAKAAVEEMVSDISSSEIAFFMLNFLFWDYLSIFLGRNLREAWLNTTTHGATRNYRVTRCCC